MLSAEYFREADCTGYMSTTTNTAQRDTRELALLLCSNLSVGHEAPNEIDSNPGLSKAK